MAGGTYVIPAENTGNSISIANSGIPMGLLLLLTYSAIVTGTPIDRSFIIDADNRTYIIPIDIRTLTVQE